MLKKENYYYWFTQSLLVKHFLSINMDYHESLSRTWWLRKMQPLFPFHTLEMVNCAISDRQNRLKFSQQRNINTEK